MTGYYIIIEVKMKKGLSTNVKIVIVFIVILSMTVGFTLGYIIASDNSDNIINNCFNSLTHSEQRGYDYLEECYNNKTIINYNVIMPQNMTYNFDMSDKFSSFINETKQEAEKQKNITQFNSCCYPRNCPQYNENCNHDCEYMVMCYGDYK
jgi:hypothetical protein